MTSFTHQNFVVIFDLDGTLFTSEEVLGKAYHAAVAQYNDETNSDHRVPPLEEILALVGRPVKDIFQKLYPDTSQDVRDEMADRVLNVLTRMIRDGGGSLYDDVHRILQNLSDRGIPLYIVSNCRRAYLEAISDTHDLAKYFEEMWCNEDAPELGKSGLASRLAGGRAGVMVGDRASDGEAARAAGLYWIGCSYGHAGDETLLQEIRGADAIVKAPREIERLVEIEWERRRS